MKSCSLYKRINSVSIYSGVSIHAFFEAWMSCDGDKDRDANPLCPQYVFV